GGSALGGAVGLSGRLGTTGLTFGASGFGGGPTLGAIFGPGGVTFGTVSRGGGPAVRAGAADAVLNGDAGGRFGATGVTLGAGRRGAPGAAGLLLEAGGASTSRNTRLVVLCLPGLVGSSSAGRPGLAGAGALARPCDIRGSPYMRRCSSSSCRKWSLSGEMSANSFSAANACCSFPAFCIRSAYVTKFCWASAMKPLAAYSLASLR